MTGKQLTLNFDNAVTLIDKDGDKFVFNRWADKNKAVMSFLHCTKSRASEVIKDPEKDWDIYTDGRQEQIVLCKGERIVYNFELCGQTYYLHGHKYNELNEWDFRKLVDGMKPKLEKKSRPKRIIVMCTEIQLKKAKQLWYATKIGFDVTAKDYQRWHLL